MMMVASQFLTLSLDQECAHKLSTWSLTWIILLFYSIYKKKSNPGNQIYFLL